jgi:hypothetical protein
MGEASFDEIFTTYYQSPSVSRAVAALEAEARADSKLDKEDRALRVYFFSTIARQDPSIVRDYEALFDRQPSGLVLSVLGQVSDEATRQFVASRLADDRFRALRRQMRDIAEGETGAAIAPLVAPGLRAHDLDLSWAEFFVKGNTAPVERIIAVLDWPDVVRERIERGLRQPTIVRFLGAGLRQSWRPSVPSRVIRRLGIAVDWRRRVVETPDDLDWLCLAPVFFDQPSPAWRLISPYLSEEQRGIASIRGAAIWSLGANAIEHVLVLETCESRLATRNGPTRLTLLEICAVARLSRGDQREAAAWARECLELSPGNREMGKLLDRATRGPTSPKGGSDE